MHGSSTSRLDARNDGEDQFFVWYLQSMDVIAAPAGLASGPGAGHSLTLDGQGETDYYTIYTLGSHGDRRNYVINILDTGALEPRRRRGSDLRLGRRRSRSSTATSPAR